MNCASSLRECDVSSSRTTTACPGRTHAPGGERPSRLVGDSGAAIGATLFPITPRHQMKHAADISAVRALVRSGRISNRAADRRGLSDSSFNQREDCVAQASSKDPGVFCSEHIDRVLRRHKRGQAPSDSPVLASVRMVNSSARAIVHSTARSSAVIALRRSSRRSGPCSFWLGACSRLSDLVELSLLSWLVACAGW